MAEDMLLEIITPPVADETDALDHFLVTLTEAISQIDGDLVAHGALGGRFGYGADYENDTFMMHHYCWCERDDCPWCGDCGCAPAAEEYVDGVRVASWYDETKGMIPAYPHDVAKYGTARYEEASRQFKAAIDARNARVKVIYLAIKHKCSRPWALDMPRRDDFGASQTAPNFWHKRTGLKVWWYKWIGRSTEVFGGEGVSIGEVAAECLASLPALSPQARKDDER